MRAKTSTSTVANAASAASFSTDSSGVQKAQTLITATNPTGSPVTGTTLNKKNTLLGTSGVTQ